MDTIVSEKALRAFMERVFEREGFSGEDARSIADVLMLSDLFGIESHGAQRMMYYHQNIASGSVDTAAQMEIVRETEIPLGRVPQEALSEIRQGKIFDDVQALEGYLESLSS